MPKLGGLQFLRALAAIMVLVGHAIAEAEHYFAVPFHLDFVPWPRGVDIFFVISGFIITLSAARYMGRPIAFLQRRMIRVVPLYYFFTTLMVITFFIFPGGPKDTIFDLGQVFSSYGFFPYARYDGKVVPILSLGWTLNYEMFFYVLCALSLLLRHASLGLCLGIFFIILLGVVSEFGATIWSFWTSSIMVEFIYGILLAKTFQAGWAIPNMSVATGIFITAFMLLIALAPTDLPRFVAAGFPAALIVAAGTLFCPPHFMRWQVLGDASYALYLSHRFTLRTATILLVPILPQSILGSWAYLFCVSVLSVGVAILVHLWLERPFLIATQNRFQA